MDFAFQIILTLVFSILTLIAGCFLGLRSQKQQTLRKYITNVVKKEYPELFKNIRVNSVLLMNGSARLTNILIFPKFTLF